MIQGNVVGRVLDIPNIRNLLEDGRKIVDHLETLANALETPELENQAIAFLFDLVETVASLGAKPGAPQAPLTLQVIPVPGAEEPIRLLLHPAVFTPEQWGRAFAEGLLKTPEIFDGTRVVELGCGSGWISLLLLFRTRAREVLGLDINKMAVLMARLNTWLNGVERDGTRRLSQYGMPIVSAFRAEVSDLVAEPLNRNEHFQHVIGCIPQVLHPDPSALGRQQSRLSDKDLYDLSNYCFEQGILEDRFGLPLIARALEQTQLCLSSGGKVTLILGGRPGPAAIESMFRRRGFEPMLKWSRRIQQADDTDLASLVALERQHGIQFNFFISRDSQLPISASTAIRLIDKGEPVYHDLLVYEAATRCETPTFGLLRHLYDLGLDSVRRELDLSRVTEEQISFLERLSGDLIKSKTLPYPHERGDLRLRQRLARFLKVYCHYEVEPENLFIGPERAQLMAMILSMVIQPGHRVLISQSLVSSYQEILVGQGLDVVVGNDDLAELMDLDEALAPTVSIIAPHQLNSPSPITLKAISRQAQAHPDRWYVIDDSAHFDIGSELNYNAFVRLASQQPLPSNLVLLYGLIKNTVFPDLVLSFLLNAPDRWIEGLDVGAELTYSRIAWPTQLYYEWLFDELLEFAFPDGEKPDRQARKTDKENFVASFSQVAADPVFAPKPVSLDTDGLIRMDYGEFEFPIPDLLVKGMIKGFLEAPVEGLPELVADRVASYIKATRSVSIAPERVVLGQGVFPLLGALIRALRERLGRPPLVALPDGTYGLCYPLVAYHGGAVQRIETNPARGFMLRMEELARANPQPDLIWFTQPNNPSGLYYEPDAVRALLKVCAEKGIYVLADEIFFLLSDVRLGEMTPPELSFGSLLASDEARWLFLADGVSKEFAAGGMRCGFMVAPDAVLARQMQSFVWLPPKSTLRAWDALYSAFLDEAPHQLMDLSKERDQIRRYLMDARELLCRQRDRLIDLLKEHGLDDGLSTRYRGGLFLLARLADRADELATEASLLVNPQNWSRTTGWSRVCFSLQPDHFNEAILRLQRFLSR